MNILLVSECSGRAINQTRRILDQFAERRGERTWQTPITMEGLNTLRRLLRKGARKNTAVACHWIRGRDHSELLWIVGDARRFNAQGAVPTNTTARDVLRGADEDDWHTAEDISLLAQLAALLHDLGKASVAFQKRLRSGSFDRNLYRHEWVSLRLFLAFVGQDDDNGWLQRLATADPESDALWLSAGRFWRDGLDLKAPRPFAGLPPLAAAVAWLVVTHHRLPTLPVNRPGSDEQQWLGSRSREFNDVERLHELLAEMRHDWNEIRSAASVEDIAPYWTMAGALPVTLAKWRARAAKLAQRLLQLIRKPGKGDWLSNPYVMHVARMSLMLADHHYSSLAPDSHLRVSGDEACSLHANTDASGRLKQALDEHLLGVAGDAAMIVRTLPGFSRHLPRLLHRSLRKRSSHDAFRWQDKAFDLAESIRERTLEHGAFIVNMASTGRGKTIANARIMYALADPQQGMRCSFAVGLRTLTLQTGRSFQKDLGLQDEQIAIRVGGSASRQLFEYHMVEAERMGSASTQALMEEDGAVLYEGSHANHPLLRMAMGDQRIARLLSAPVLVCTIDHLTPATEAQRSGRQIAPMLRLMSGDLVLDEPDDFDLSDLPALARLVHWAGMLGARVLLSSATLPPDLVSGLFDAYRHGRMQYQRNRGSGGGQALPPPDVPCMWVDEFKSTSVDCGDQAGYSAAHADFVGARVRALKKDAEQDGVKRVGEILPLDIKAKTQPGIRQEFSIAVGNAIQQAHAAHAQADPKTGKRISFGLVRMANIEPLQTVALGLFERGAPAGIRMHLCVYHSRFPLLLRSEIERELDAVLDRRDEERVFNHPRVRAALDASDAQEHVFVVLASPVAEVGRDHDYDWAVVEPSSMRSLIQLAGRVRRHRKPGCGLPNVLIFERNLRHFEARGKAAFIRPGFEEDRASYLKEPLRLPSCPLKELLRPQEWQEIDARPRIKLESKQALEPRRYLVDLEHFRMQLLMRPLKSNALNAASAWATPRSSLTWVLPQQQPFRAQEGAGDETLVFLPDDDGEQLIIHRVHEERRRGRNKAIYTPAESSLQHLNLPKRLGPRIEPWMQADMMQLLEKLADTEGMTLQAAAARFTIANVRAPGKNQIARWYWHPVLGFARAS